jgi:predicted nucleic acid-binding protein
MIVVDTNVIAYLWLGGPHAGHAEQLLQKDPAWTAPLLWRSELRSILAGCLRHRQLSLAAAREIATSAEGQLKEREFAVAPSDVLRLVASSNCSAYDCEFVALAEALGVPLVTNDGQVLEEFPSIAQLLAEFVEN